MRADHSDEYFLTGSTEFGPRNAQCEPSDLAQEECNLDDIGL